MTLHIELSSQTEAKLRERAAASGKDLGSYALDAIEQKLAADQGNGAVPTSPRQGGEEWFARFSKWVAAHPPRPLLADDRRDAIYGEEPGDNR